MGSSMEVHDNNETAMLKIWRAIMKKRNCFTVRSVCVGPGLGAMANFLAFFARK